jgi:hypothetical protein
MLQFGMKLPLHHSDLIEQCGYELTKDDMNVLRRAVIEPSIDIEDGSLWLREWKLFDRNLRNELTRARAIKKGKDPNNYLRSSDGIDSFIAPVIHWAMSQESPMEAELYLDKIRWEKIEDMKAGHYFDMGHLLAYSIQLQILERWDKINSGDGMKILERLVGKI